MSDNTEAYAVAVIIVFGAVILGGLMAATIAFDELDAFLLALGAAGVAWLSGHVLLLDRPRIYAFLLAVSTALAIGSTLALAL